MPKFFKKSGDSPAGSRPRPGGGTGGGGKRFPSRGGDDRPSRPYAGKRRDDDDTGPPRRESRPGGDRPPFRGRDDRPASSRPFRSGPPRDRDDRPRDDRAGRPPRRDFAPRGDAGADRPRKPFDRDDRPRKSFDRDDRPRQSFDRDDRPRQSFDRGDRPRKSFDRDDRPAKPFNRTDRPSRPFDRAEKRSRPFDREDRPRKSFDRDDRPRKPVARDDRPFKKFDRPSYGPSSRPGTDRDRDRHAEDKPWQRKRDVPEESFDGEPAIDQERINTYAEGIRQNLDEIFEGAEAEELAHPRDPDRVLPRKSVEHARELPKLVAGGAHRPKREPRLVLSTDNVRSPKIRHNWIYDNMIASTGGDIRDGGWVAVYSEENKFLGSAIYNAQSRIVARIYSLDRIPFDEHFLRSALTAAVERRRQIYDPSDSYRVVFSDSDFLPGLIVDKIGNCLSVQVLTFAMDERHEAIIAMLQELLSPQGMVINRNSPVREKEGLELHEPRIIGDVPSPLAVQQDGFTVYADLVGGQKTGLFLDHRFNRRMLQGRCEGKRVLDLFCYVGAWSLSAAKAGASEVTGVDSSNDALNLARRAATESGFEQINFITSDAFDYVSDAAKRAEHFDVIVCDPPAFAKTRKHVEDALKAYLSLNYRAMKMIPLSGILITSSCSQHVTHEEFRDMLETAARNARMHFHIAQIGSQPPDHPVLLGLPESDYLKCYLLQRVQ